MTKEEEGMRAMCWNKRNWIRISQEKGRSVPKNWIAGFKCPCSTKVFHSSYSNFIFRRRAFLFFVLLTWRGENSSETVRSLRSLKINATVDSVSDWKTIGFVFTTQQIDLSQPADGKSLSLHKVACKEIFGRNVREILQKRWLFKREEHLAQQAGLRDTLLGI